MRSIGPAVTREQSPAFLRNSNGRLDFPGPTQEASWIPRRNSRIPPQLEKNHVVAPSSQDEHVDLWSILSLPYCTWKVLVQCGLFPNDWLDIWNQWWPIAFSPVIWDTVFIQYWIDMYSLILLQVFLWCSIDLSVSSATNLFKYRGFLACFNIW